MSRRWQQAKGVKKVATSEDCQDGGLSRWRKQATGVKIVGKSGSCRECGASEKKIPSYKIQGRRMEEGWNKLEEGWKKLEVEDKKNR